MFLDYADAEFTRDTVESNERAKVLLRNHARSLERRPFDSGAESLSAHPVFTVVIATLNPAWINAYHGVFGGLAKVTDAPRMAALTQEIRSIIDASGMSEAQRFASYERRCAVS